MKKERKRLSKGLKSTEDNLAKATSAHDEAMSETIQMELELNKLKDYVLTVHSQSFRQVVHQAVLLYGVPEHNEMVKNKDVYNGQLVPIEEIPTPATHETTTILDEGSAKDEERTP